MQSYRLQNTSYYLFIILAGGYLLTIGSTIIIPIVFAILFSIFLNPLENKYRSLVKKKWLSIILSFLSVLLPLVLITTLFSFQLINIMDSLPSITQGTTAGFEKLIQKINDIFPFLRLDAEAIIPSKDPDLEGPLKLLSQGIRSTTELLGSIGLITIYVFLLLFYKDSFTNFIVYTFEKENRPDIKEALFEIKETVQSYLGGLGIVVVILSVLNTIGLTIIGIEHPIFWGTLAGILAIIPYIGTLLGGLLPFIYALSTADANWQPYAVIIYYLFIQQIEGNFITPKIIGDKVDINPLFAILALVFFASFWGVGGVILALPLISIIKIILKQFESTYALSVLMSSDISSKQGIFKKIALRK